MSTHENPLVNTLTQYFLYKTSPAVFKLLYDKYYRTDIYNDIRQKTFATVEEIPINFSPGVYNDKIPTNVADFKILDYYMNRSENSIKAIATFSAACLNGLIYGILRTLQLEKKEFIFLDNNRMIYNRLNLAKIIFREFVKVNGVLLLGLSFIYLVRFISYRFHPPEEIEMVMNKYPRDIALYNRLKV
jgi:hypothetical protein